MALFKRKNKKLAAPEGEVKNSEEMSFFDHLEELRWHIIRSLIYIAVCAIGIFFAKHFVFHTVLFGPTRDDFITYRFFCSLSDSLCLSPNDLELFTKDLGEQFLNHIKVSFWLGLVVAFPLVFREFWNFVKPGLYSAEKKVTRGVVFVCSLLFIIGVLFGYFVVSPFAVTFLAGYEVSDTVRNTITLKSLINYMTMFTIPTGLVFELPIVVFFLAKIGLIYPSTMKKFRKHAIVVILALAAIITPPDVITQFLIGIPLYILYELSIIICHRVNPDKKEP